MVSTAEQAAQRLSVALRATHTCLFELELQGFTYTHACNCREIFGLEDTQLLALLRQTPRPITKRSPVCCCTLRIMRA